MSDDVCDKRRRAKKKRSSLSTWKKKFNIKKRFANKLPLHGRHIRALMSGWQLSDVRSVLTQYEITGMLKQLSIMADKARVACPALEEDLAHVYKEKLCCDIRIVCCQHSDAGCDGSASEDLEFLAHSALVSNRWPLIRAAIRTQLGDRGRRSYHEDTDVPLVYNTAGEASAETLNGARMLPTIYVTDFPPKDFCEFMKEAYSGTENEGRKAPRKLQPLPTTDESFHLRNKSNQPFSNRHTILDCEQPAVPRRPVTRRKQKHRFSMDERILVNISPGTGSSRASSCKYPQDVKLSPMNAPYKQSFNLSVSPEKSLQGMHPDKEIPNSLHDDLSRMYKEAENGFGDLKIVFTCDPSTNFTPWITPHARRRDFSNHYQAWMSHYESSNFYSPPSSREWQEPLCCHRVVLAARSLYFRRLIHKQLMHVNLRDSPSLVTTLELEGSVIPPRYMCVVLHAMYTDKVDINRLYERCGQLGVHMGTRSPFYLRDAMMLHHIGCFIEFPHLVQGCEEIIVNALDQNNLLQILHWTSLSHGSQWVKRQVDNYMREKFSELLASGVLFELTAPQLKEVLKSDFVNAAELDVLKCALRWGEHELLRRVEEREPNLLTHTAHSVSRSKTASARRRDLIASRIDELHDCTAPVLACVRMQHLLPPNHELFTNAEKRGVISRPPTDLLENVNEGSSRQWIKSRVDFVPPRLFQPYVNETKNILDERFAQDTDCVSLRSVHNLRDQSWSLVRHHVNSYGIPDALYMVGRARIPARRRYRNQEPPLTFVRNVNPTLQESEPKKFIGNYHPVPDPLVMRDLFNRERELRSTSIVTKVLRACIDCCHSNNELFGGGIFQGRPDALSSQASSEDSEDAEYCNRCTAIRLVRLFVVREKGQPDCAVDLLRHPELYYTVQELQVAMAADGMAPTFVSERPPPVPQRLKSLYPTSGVSNSTNQPGAERFPVDPPGGALGAQGSSPLAHGNVTNGMQIPLRLGSQRREKINKQTAPLPAVRNVPDPRLAYDSVASSSSSEDDTPRMRRQRRSVSRKGSSSTTSHHSIPDVAASANSSLQRLRASSFRSSGGNAANSPQICSEATGHIVSAQPLLVDTSDVTSSTSCEENTSENEEDSDFALRQKLEELSRISVQNFCLDAGPLLLDLPESDLLAIPLQSAADVAGTSFSARSVDTGPRVRQPAPSLPPRSQFRPPALSDMFASDLNFIDDNAGLSPESDGGSGSDVSEQRELEMPELVRDGTLPRGLGARGDARGTSTLKKPDIYPSADEFLDGDFEEQCGKYFFCTLSRSTQGDGSGERNRRESDPVPPRRTCDAAPGVGLEEVDPGSRPGETGV